MKEHLRIMSKEGILAKPVIPIMESLYKFMYHNPLAVNENPLSLPMIMHLGYDELLQALYDIIIAKRYKK